MSRLCNSVKAYKAANDIYPSNLYDLYIAWQENDVAEDICKKVSLKRTKGIVFKDPNEFSEHIGCRLFKIDEQNWFIIELDTRIKSYPYRLMINQNGVLYRLKEIGTSVDMHDWYIEEVRLKRMN